MLIPFVDLLNHGGEEMVMHDDLGRSALASNVRSGMLQPFALTLDLCPALLHSLFPTLRMFPLILACLLNLMPEVFVS